MGGSPGRAGRALSLQFKPGPSEGEREKNKGWKHPRLLYRPGKVEQGLQAALEPSPASSHVACCHWLRTAVGGMSSDEQKDGVQTQLLSLETSSSLSLKVCKVYSNDHQSNGGV